MKTGYAEHQERVKEHGPRTVSCAIITVSDTRTESTDKSGELIKTQLREHGHHVAQYAIVPDDAPQIVGLIEDFVKSCDILILNGGTGIAKRDSTFEAVSGLLEKHLPGFGELFRVLSYDEIGAAAMFSRATAGLYKETLIFSLPGSSNAVKLALEKLILPELTHLVWEMTRS